MENNGSPGDEFVRAFSYYMNVKRLVGYTCNSNVTFSYPLSSCRVCSKRSSKNGSNEVIWPFTSNGGGNVFKERFHFAEDMVGVSEATGLVSFLSLQCCRLLLFLVKYWKDHSFSLHLHVSFLNIT